MEYYKNLDLADIKYFCEIDQIEKIEEWKGIKDFEGRYEVSDLGRVKSLARQFGTTYYGAPRFLKARILKSRFDDNGYIQFYLCKEGKMKSMKVHVIVAMTFLGHIPNGYITVVDHKDNIKTNNYLTNLQLITTRNNTSKNKHSSSTYTGVHKNKRDGNWTSSITISKTLIFIGNFKDVDKAALSYRIALENIDKYDGDNKKFRDLVKSFL